MPDIENEVRELLRERSEDIGFDPRIPSPVVRRSRRRRTTLIGVAGVWLVFQATWAAVASPPDATAASACCQLSASPVSTSASAVAATARASDSCWRAGWTSRRSSAVVVMVGHRESGRARTRPRSARGRA